MEPLSQYSGKQQVMQTHMHSESHHEGTETTPSATKHRTLYFDNIEPDCRDKMRVCLFFWNWGSGLAIFNLQVNVATVILEYLPTWKIRHINDGINSDAGMAYIPSLRFPLGREFQSGVQMSRNTAEAFDYVRRRMRPI